MKQFLNYSSILIFLVSLVVAMGAFAGSAEAAMQPVTGWGWSDNTGWLSMTCENQSECSQAYYAVQLEDTTGDLSGYGLFNPGDATQGDIGFISFGPFGKLTAPDYPDPAPGTVEKSAEVDLASADPANNIPANVVGWARACAVFETDCAEKSIGGVYPGNIKANSLRGSWDGWISMSGTGYGVTLDLETGEFDGYAWGGDVIGWIDFSGIVTDPLVEEVAYDLTITADPLYVNSPAGNGGVNDTTTLTWNTVAANYNLCEAESPQLVTGWHGTNPTPPAPGLPQSQAGVEVPAQVTTYSIRCSEDNGVTWTGWISVDVQFSDIDFDFANGANCVEPGTNTITVEYSTTNPNFVSCTASSLVAGTGNPLADWSGPVATVPTPGNSPVTYAINASDLGSAANLPITLGIQCTDGVALFPPDGPVEVSVDSMCAATNPTVTITAAPSDCVDAVPGVTNLVLEAFDATFDRCYSSSTPAAPDWSSPSPNNILAPGGLVPGIPQTFTNISVSQVPQAYRVRCYDDDTGTVIDASESVNWICGQPPVVNLSAAPTYVNPGAASNLTWNNSYVQVCELNTIPTDSGDPTVDGYNLTSSERHNGSRSTGNLDESTYFYLNCINPFGEAYDTAIVGVGEDPNGLPVNPCLLYPDDIACVGKKPIFEEL